MQRLAVIAFASVFVAACTPQEHISGPVADDLKTARSYEQNGDMSSAAGIYAKLLQKDDAPAEAYIRMAALMRKIGQPDQAVAVMQKADLKMPGNPEVMSQLGYANVAAGHYQEAVGVFDKLSAMQPDNAMAYNGKAVAFDKAGNHAAAQDIYKKALSLSPDSVSITNNEAMSLILDGKVDKAIAILEPLSQKPEANATVRQNLALAYTIKGDKKRALEITSHDLTPQQAQENMAFYERYARKQGRPAKPAKAALSKPADAKTLQDVLEPQEGSAPTN